MTETARVKGDCPKCGRDRWAEVRANYKESGDAGQIAWTRDHRILQCPACDEVYHQTDFVHEEGYSYNYIGPSVENSEVVYDHHIDHWPTSMEDKHVEPSWLNELRLRDRILSELLSETYLALGAGLRVLAVIGFRTCFDRATELAEIDPSLSFAAKLGKLHNRGLIGAAEQKMLAIATDAGSAAAHRGWQPRDEDIETVKQTVEAFIFRNFVLKDGTESLRQAVPPRKIAADTE